MENKKSDCLRELIRILVRDLGLLEKSDSSCQGVTISQCHAIVEIGRAKEISLNELAGILELDKSTMSRTINKLVGDSLVLRETHPEDRRYIVIKLTEKGMKVFKTIEENMSTYYKNIFIAIPENKREQILDSLKVLIDVIHENKCC
ncbi:MULTISPECIES: MarR family winged helix-turn-helix transcriptional regulator [Clostridium]|uniref:MarR family winged helix-turn-helix transcriptional regulator n=1 Tax=Clostridium TaxID=1485 RepID=UPI000825A69A|nr:MULTISPECIES: MarR family transcriptional regulator [Clostridium]PJI10478.1 MarR family transcriptional regulator [Clostridium sp. CT7]